MIIGDLLIRCFFLIFISIALVSASFAQTTCLIKGYVYDKSDRKPISAAAVRIYPGSLATSTNDDGKFQARLLITGRHRIAVSHVGYETALHEITTPPDTFLNIGLSSSTISLSEIVVTATRSGIFKDNAPVSVDVITPADLVNANGSSLASAVAHSSGFYVKDYGGLGGLKTVSMRGMGGEHTMVLLNGIRVNNYQNGLIDLGLWSLDQVERIEIVRGGKSSLYGADAVGGVVNLISKDEVMKTAASVSGGFGSFGFQRYSLRIEHQLTSVSLRGSFTSERGRNEYSFSSLGGIGRIGLRRANNDSELESGLLQVISRPGEQSRLTGLVRSTTSHRGLPGPALSESSGRARQDDHDVFGLVNYRTPINDRLLADLSTHFHYSDLRYTNPDIILGGRVLESFSKTTSIGLSGSIQSQWRENALLAIGADFGYASGASPDLMNNFDRMIAAAFLSSEVSFSSPSFFFHRASFYPMLRVDSFRDHVGATTAVRSEWSPKFGMSLMILEDGALYLRSSIGRSFRIPTFNDLYWTPGGNPNLLPEHSRSFDIGLEASGSFLGKHRLEITYFNIDTKNRILWIPTSNVEIWSPKNIDRTTSAGVEIGLRSRILGDRVEVRVNETRTQARKKNSSGENDPTFDKQSIYVPQEVTNFSLALYVAPFQVNFVHQYVSHRFYTETNDRFLPAYRVTDANVIAFFTSGDFKLTAKVEVNNVFNKEYQVIAFYPQPPRHYRITLGLTR